MITDLLAAATDVRVVAALALPAAVVVRAYFSYRTIVVKERSRNRRLDAAIGGTAPGQRPEILRAVGAIEGTASPAQPEECPGVPSSRPVHRVRPSAPSPGGAETSVGADRTTLAVLVNAYREEKVEGEDEGRTVLALHPGIAPIKAGVFPLVKKDGMPEFAEKLTKDLRKHFPVFYDESGAIGRRYRRQDEVGTPYCITVDGQTTQDGTVTLRNRDTLQQERVAADQVASIVLARIES